MGISRQETIQYNACDECLGVEKDGCPGIPPQKKHAKFPQRYIVWIKKAFWVLGGRNFETTDSCSCITHIRESTLAFCCLNESTEDVKHVRSLGLRGTSAYDYFIVD